jgi:hypothetical protein
MFILTSNFDNGAQTRTSNFDNGAQTRTSNFDNGAQTRRMLVVNCGCSLKERYHYGCSTKEDDDGEFIMVAQPRKMMLWTETMKNIRYGRRMFMFHLLF